MYQKVKIAQLLLASFDIYIRVYTIWTNGTFDTISNSYAIQTFGILQLVELVKT